MDRPALTAEYRAALDRDGYVVVAEALDPAWVERLRRAFADASAQRDGTQHVTVTPETPEHASWRALKEHPVVIAAADHVLGRPFRVSEPHGRNPLPGYGLQGLHADWMPRDVVEPYFVLTTIWMLDDFTADNGATRVVPGSHRLLRPIPKSLAQPTAVHPDERVVLVFNGHTWHAGTKNTSDRARRAVQMVVGRG